MRERTSTERNFLSRITPGQWLGLALVVVAVVFVLQNQRTVSVELFWLDARAPLWLTLLVVLVVGWLAGALMGGRRRG
ncbi:hypothetical protein [Georgenia sp. AZ-5]|uniref:hypothetical protein n=1 Tax=Georgenia sp. AZ-5 TaxID=3367526 RepID=UPI0037542C2B